MSLEHVQTDVWGLDVVFLSIGLYKAVSLGNAVAECCCLTDSQRSNPMHQLFFCAVYLYTHKKRNSRTPFTIQEKRSLRERERPHVHHQANLLHLYFYYKCSFPCFDFFKFYIVLFIFFNYFSLSFCCPVLPYRLWTASNQLYKNQTK